MVDYAIRPPVFSGLSERPSATWKDPSPIDGAALLTDATERFSMSRTQLAEMLGFRADTLQRASRANAPLTQARLTEMLEIVRRVSAWAGGERQGLAWYRGEPIPAFGDRTAESLVKEGKATTVRDYLDHIALGGFA